MISRLETGAALPTLAVGLLLRLALGAHLSEIYVDLNAELERLILKRAASLPPSVGRSIRGRILGRDT